MIKDIFLKTLSKRHMYHETKCVNISIFAIFWYKKTVLRRKRENEKIQFRMFQNFIKIRCGTRTKNLGFGLGFLENRIRNFGLGSPIEKTETE
jgi:hypothetical protein